MFYVLQNRFYAATVRCVVFVTAWRYKHKHRNDKIDAITSRLHEDTYSREFDVYILRHEVRYTYLDMQSSCKCTDSDTRSNAYKTSHEYGYSRSNIKVQRQKTKMKEKVTTLFKKLRNHENEKDKYKRARRFQLGNPKRRREQSESVCS